MIDKPKTDPVTLPEWRCCRLACYPPRTPVESMQGHYIRAATQAEAAEEMTRRFGEYESFSIVRWKDPAR